MAARMTIADIRREITRAENARNMLTGSGRDEDFARQPVADTLLPRIAALRALEIPARFADDNSRRGREIQHCQDTIARWTALQAPSAARALGMPVRAGEPWSALEDAMLRAAVDMQATPEAIAHLLQRTVAGVTARLDRHALLGQTTSARVQ